MQQILLLSLLLDLTYGVRFIPDVTLGGEYSILNVSNPNATSSGTGWDQPPSLPDFSQQSRWTWHTSISQRLPSDNWGDSNAIQRFWLETSPRVSLQSPQLKREGCVAFLKDWGKRVEHGQNCDALMDQKCQRQLLDAVFWWQDSRYSYPVYLNNSDTLMCEALQEWFDGDYLDNRCTGFGSAIVKNLIGPGMSDTADVGYGSINNNTVATFVSWGSKPDGDQFSRVWKDPTIVLTAMWYNKTRTGSAGPADLRLDCIPSFGQPPAKVSSESEIRPRLVYYLPLMAAVLLAVVF